MKQIAIGLSLFIIVCLSYVNANEQLHHDNFVNDGVLNNGASIYLDRCSLCHGNTAMGEGLIPLVINDYPSTNLLQPKHTTDKASVRDAVLWGGASGEMSELSPAWKDELTEQEVNSVVDFVLHLRSDYETGVKRIKYTVNASGPDVSKGQHIYKTRCALCHGDSGEGDGKMRKIIKKPPPYNLTESTVPDEYLRLIIEQGGEPIGRSPQMPPWKDELTEAEIQSVILYVRQLRNN